VETLKEAALWISNLRERLTIEKYKKFKTNNPVSSESPQQLDISTSPFEEKQEVLHSTRDYLEYLGFERDGDKWIDKHQCFVYDNKLPSELKDFIAIQTGTAHARGYEKGKQYIKKKNNAL
jgi:hypothetical protein